MILFDKDDKLIDVFYNQFAYKFIDIFYQYYASLLAVKFLKKGAIK